jgi:hypothetical protein
VESGRETAYQHWMETNLWKRLANELHIEVVTPFSFDSTNGPVEFTALLPEFGAKRGMVVDADWDVINPHTDELLAAGFGFSCCGGGNYDDADLPIDMLRDWGWSSRAVKPDWL